MTNKEKYDKVFIDCFLIEQNHLNNDLVYNSVQEWDSVGHMAMIAGIEDVFNIEMETDDIIDFSSYTKGIELLKKYNIDI